MKLTHRKIYDRCLIVLTGIALTICSIQGMVLCHAEDGHIAIEPVSSICCDNLHTGPDRSITSLKEAFSSSDDNCGPCVDTPMSIMFLKGFKKSSVLNPMSVASAANIHTTITDHDFSGYQLDSELFASVNPYLACLRTIILQR